VAWYWWVLIWLVVLVVTGVVLGLMVRSLWRRGKELAREIDTATQRLGAISDGLQELAERHSDPAVFTPASQLRQERYLSGRHRDGRHSAVQGSDPGRRSPRGSQQRVR
jgi:flagellar biosynthesis/type III secretory pathway M-ring protein FliF/YscJ